MENLNVSRKDLECFNKSSKTKKQLGAIGICTFLGVFILMPTIMLSAMYYINDNISTLIIATLIAGGIACIFTHFSFKLEEVIMKKYVDYLRNSDTIFMVDPYFKKEVGSCLVDLSDNLKAWLPEGEEKYYFVFRPFKYTDTVLKFETTKDLYESLNNEFKAQRQLFSENYFFYNDKSLIMGEYKMTTIKEMCGLA